jgi:hypothetical protein
MKKRGRPPKAEQASEPDQPMRGNTITADQITPDDIARVEREICVKAGMWAQVSPDRLIAGVLNAMEGK